MQKMQREQQIQAANGTANTPGGRNNLKHLREEYEALNREIDKTNEKTDTFRNLILGIGNNYLSKISEQFSNFLFNNLAGNAAIGDMGAGSTLFGQKNPQTDALNKNTEAILMNTSALTGKAFTGPNGQPVGVGPTAAVGDGAIGPNGQPIKGGGKLGSITAGLAQGLLGGLAGLGVGAAITQGRAKTGGGGATGGAIGGLLGSLAPMALGAFGPGGAAIGGIISAVGPLVGGFLGSFFDKDIDPLKKTLDELEDSVGNLTYELMSVEKSLNTVNDTMENIINAPSNFVLPIPKGILDNSITTQSAIATPLQAGGLIRRGGLAFLHPGETVNSASSKSGGGNMDVSFVINGGNNNPQEIADEVMDKLNSQFFKQNQRSSNYASRF
jgi:hypothetical protein